MNSIEQVEENMKDFPVLSIEEKKALEKVCEIINRNTAVPCTGCSYCASHCPKKIPIPQYFKMYNEIYRYPKEGWKIIPAYEHMTLQFEKASGCAGCGICALHCPQKIQIPEVMKKVSDVLER